MRAPILKVRPEPTADSDEQTSRAAEESRTEMVCIERVRLVESYFTATSAHFAALAGITQKTGADFRNALLKTAAARAQCAKARIALLDHKNFHCCRRCWSGK
jgi:hypothetical protein